MQRLRNISELADNAWAAFMFFTRLPLWRVHQPRRESFSAVVEFWPLAGWITGGVMALSLFVFNMFFPTAIAAVLAIIMRLLITGCLHEDGLADFFDGFGGGTSRQRILDIMKDSHIGTYGVISLIAYFLLLYLAIVNLPTNIAPLLILAADPFSKMLSSQIVQMMPYARSENEAKAGVVYRGISTFSAVLLTFQGLLPTVLFILFADIPNNWHWMLFTPCLVMYFLYLLIWRKLRGYTGDCCGAMCLLVELSIYLIASAIY